MINNKLYPFERNRYYPGKMLTSADFQAEQNYHINKVRFLNGLMYGAGVICGLGVFSLDDQSVLIESGAAIDGHGREVIVDSSAVKKLSAIEGFDRLTGDTARLYIRFKEQEIHNVYSVNRNEDEKEYEFNRISEGYELFLTDKEVEESTYAPETEFLTRETLFKSENYIGEIMIPGTVSKGKNVKIVLEIRKLSSENVNLNCRGLLEMPAFETAEGSHEIEIGMENLNLLEGEVIRKDYWVHVMDVPAVVTELILRSGTAFAFENDNAINTSSNFSLRVMLSKISPIELVSNETGKLNLEMRGIGLMDDSVPIADLRIVRTANNYLIESIIEDTVKRYIATPAQILMRSKYMAYFNKEVDISEIAAVHQAPVVTNNGSTRTEFSNIATGTLEVPLGKNARSGDIRYSGEIPHGLGAGNVYVDIGYSYVSDDPELGANQKCTFYGNPDLFSGKNDPMTDVETAVKVLNEKGSFVVAARLLRDVDYLTLTFRWVAIRFPSGDEMEMTEDYFDKSISVATPTVIMGTKESHFFSVRFNNMKATGITYELTSPGSGEISSDGVYTAPAREGVYEIRIYCTEMPVICTYAYAIVRKKMIGDSEGGGDSV
jgi:hypothetical protein